MNEKTKDERLKYKMPPTVRMMFAAMLAQVTPLDAALALFDIVGRDYNRLAELEAENAAMKAENKSLRTRGEESAVEHFKH